MAPWLQRRGGNPREGRAHLEVGPCFSSSGASDTSDSSSDPSKKLTVEGAEELSISADSDSSGVSVVSLLFLRPSCSFRLLRELVPSGPSGWVRGCFRHTTPHWLCKRSKVRRPARPAAKPGSVGRVCGWLAGERPAWEQRPVGDLHPRSCRGPDSRVPQAAVPRGPVEGSPLSWRWGSVLMEVCVTGNMKCQSVYLWEPCFLF